MKLAFWQRLGVRLGLLIVLIVLFQAAFLIRLPNHLFGARNTPLVPAELDLQDDAAFGRTVRALLDGRPLAPAEQQAQLERLLLARMNLQEGEQAAAFSNTLMAVYEPRATFTPLFLLLLFGLPTLTLALLLSQWVGKPVSAVVEAAAAVASGNLRARVLLPPRLPQVQDEIMLLAQSFNTMAQTLEQYERERQRTVAMIAHELRTPLSIMQAQLDALLEGVRPLSLNSLELLAQQTEQLTHLVEDLRLLSLAEAGRLRLEKGKTDLKGLLETTQRSFALRAEAKAVSLRLELPAAEAYAQLDAARVQQILHNLLENALRYTPPGGQITLNLSRTGASYSLCVRDTGRGIPPAQLPTLFKPFSHSGEAQAGGSGLGLAIVHSLVTLHGGTIEARNLETGGACFTLTLPA